MDSRPSVELAWEVHGPVGAPGVLCLHSLGTDRSLWHEQARSLQDRYRLLLVDLRGHGESPVPSGPYALAALGADVLRAADAAGFTRSACLGISLGGLIAQWLAIHHPERVSRLVLANTAARIGTEQSWQERIRAVDELGLPALCDAVLARWFAPSLAVQQPTTVERFRRILAATSAQGYTGCCHALAAADLRHEISAIRSPTLVVAGTLDLSTPVAAAFELQRAIPGSELRVLDGAAHLSNVDDPEAFNVCVAAFLDGAARTIRP